MIQLESLNHGLKAAKNNKLPKFLKKIKEKKQGFYTCIDNKKTISEINKLAAKLKGKHEQIVILGIGGSALGASCLQQALTHLYKTPKLHVLDNIDPTMIRELEDIINPQKTLFIVITKSGKTPETLAQFDYFKKKVPIENFVIITGPKSDLKKQANKLKIPTLTIPENVGGRFSVLTAVGLFPAKLLGLNTSQLLTGAREMKKLFLSKSAQKNLPFQIATIQYQSYKKKKHINVMMPYAQKLRRFADWYSQLLAESIGKNPRTGITPVNALGVTDQHSQLQLYAAGPNDKLYTFIEVTRLAPSLQPFTKLISIEKKATEISLTEAKRPNITIRIDKISEKNLGALFMLYEGATAFLAEYFKINAFDQPGVERSKVLTKQLLEQ